MSSECYVGGIDPTTRLILSLILLVFILPFTLFIVSYLGELVLNALNEGNISIAFLHIAFIALTIFILFLVIANLVLAALCLAQRKRIR